MTTVPSIECTVTARSKRSSKLLSSYSLLNARLTAPDSQRRSASVNAQIDQSESRSAITLEDFDQSKLCSRRDMFFLYENISVTCTCSCTEGLFCFVNVTLSFEYFLKTEVELKNLRVRPNLKLCSLLAARQTTAEAFSVF